MSSARGSSRQVLSRARESSAGRSVFLGWRSRGPKKAKRVLPFSPLSGKMAKVQIEEHFMTRTAGKGMVRCKALTMSELAAQEKHGKRQDKTSRLRVIREDSPLVHGSLDLRSRYDVHMEGVRQNAGAKRPVLHFIVRFPPELLDGPPIGRVKGSKKDRQKAMLIQAMAYIQKTHGGDAVFAARIDRDEEGETIVDVFAAPKYEKRTKRTKPDASGVRWASATKFGKELAEKHQPEIRRRFPTAKEGSLTSPRMVGIALQSEFAAFFERVNGVPLDRKKEKDSATPDRLETEALKRLRAERAEMEQEHLERSAAVDVWGQELAAKEAEMEEKASRLGWVRDRIMGLVKAFGDAFGLPLPKGMSDALSALEAEMEQRIASTRRDPFRELAAKNSPEDSEPGL